MSETEHPGKPQGETTGRWELIEGARGKDISRGRRWNEVPIWYRVLDRFGFPTMFALMMMAGLSWTVKFVLTKWDEHEVKVAEAMSKQAESTAALGKEVSTLNANLTTSLAVVVEKLSKEPPRRSINTDKVIPMRSTSLPLPKAVGLSEDPPTVKATVK